MRTPSFGYLSLIILLGCDRPVSTDDTGSIQSVSATSIPAGTTVDFWSYWILPAGSEIVVSGTEFRGPRICVNSFSGTNFVTDSIVNLVTVGNAGPNGQGQGPWPWAISAQSIPRGTRLKVDAWIPTFCNQMARHTATVQ
jgi:hypothetical protein